MGEGQGAAGPLGLEIRLRSGEVARCIGELWLPSGEATMCIGESATQGAPGGARRLPGGSGGSKIAPWRLPRSSGGSKIAPRRPPEDPRGPQRPPGGPQEAQNDQTCSKNAAFSRVLGGPRPGTFYPPGTLLQRLFGPGGRLQRRVLSLRTSERRTPGTPVTKWLKT